MVPLPARWVPALLVPIALSFPLGASSEVTKADLDRATKLCEARSRQEKTNYPAVLLWGSALTADSPLRCPNLETSPAEATPSGNITLRPTYASYMDDHVAFYYNTLPKGTYNFYFRTRSTIEGSYTQPPTRAEMMYDGAVFGNSAGAKITVKRTTE